MAVWTAIPAKAVDEALTVDNWGSHLKGNLEYLKASADAIVKASGTSPVTVSATTEATATVLLATASATFDGSEVEVRYEGQWDNTGNSVLTKVVLLRDATVIGQWQLPTTGTAEFLPVNVSWHDTPGAGSHTYTVKAYVNTSSGVMQAGAGGSGSWLPQRITVTKAR